MALSPRTALFYCGYVLGWSLLITLGGGLVGAIVFPIVGLLAGYEATVPAMIWSGAWQIAFLTFIWAFGGAIVMAFNHAHRRRSAAGPPPEAGADR